MKKEIDPERVRRDSAYRTDLKEAFLEDLMTAAIRQEPLIILAYFDFSPDLTADLAPEAESAGIVLERASTEDGRVLFRRQKNIRIDNFYVSNACMRWYYEPIRKKRGVWSRVCFDPYTDQDVITYSLPLYMGGNLLGVIQNKVIVRIGSTKPIHIDFRLISAVLFPKTKSRRAAFSRRRSCFSISIPRKRSPEHTAKYGK